MKRWLCAALLLSLLAGCALRNGDAKTEAEAESGTEAAVEDAAAAAVGRLLADMDREEKAWQMLVLFPQQITGAASTGNGTLWASGFAARRVGGEDRSAALCGRGGRECRPPCVQSRRDHQIQAHVHIP